jgi:hypothetical protein
MIKEEKPEPKCEEKVVTVVKVVQNEEELTLDEKIRKIRAELNLPDDKQQERLNKRLEEYESRYRVDCREPCDDELEEKQHHSPTEKYAVNVIVNKKEKRRSRSKSADRSRAKSAERPDWKPTGRNIYTRAHGEIVLNRRKENQEASTNTDAYCEPPVVYYYEREPSYCLPAPQPTYYTTTEYKPAKTTVKTTVQTIKNNGLYTINNCNSGTLPTIKQTINTFQANSSSRPVSAGYFNNSRSVDSYHHHHQGQQTRHQQVYYS